VGELLARTLAVYQRGFGVLIRIVLVGEVPLILTVFAPTEALIRALVVAMLFMIPVAISAVAYAVSQLYLGRPISAAGSYVAVMENGISLLVNTLIFYGALTVGGILTFFVIGIPVLLFLVVVWPFYVQAVVIEGRGPFHALMRSLELVRGSWWRVFGILVVFVVILFAIGSVASVPGSLLFQLQPTLGYLAIVIAGALLRLTLYIGATLLYFDLRIRKEGLTLEQLAEDVGREQPTP
jgi:hypothetical protein